MGNPIEEFDARAGFEGLAEISLKSLAILAVVLGFQLLLRRASAAMRHLAWLLGIMSLLCLPILTLLLPRNEIAILPLSPGDRVVALHDAGCAEIAAAEFIKLGEMKLKPWGRLKGRVRRGSSPAAGVDLRLDLVTKFDPIGEASPPRFEGTYSATTDGEGRFAFERVFPGKGVVARQVGTRGGDPLASHAIEVEIRPGKVSHVDIGGTGRPVKGRLFYFPGSGENAPWWRSSALLRPRRDRETGSAPVPSRLQYVARIEESGALEIDDVPPGFYELDAHLRESPSKYVGVGETIAALRREVVIPNTESPEGAPPVDLGILELRPIRHAKVGEAAPSFSARGLDGGTIRLEDFRGQYLLIDFWATCCGPCRSEMERLKRIQRDFAADKRFAILGLSLDPDIEAPRRYAADQMLSWRQGYLGQWEDSEVAQAYGVPWLPQLILIGPDGTVLYRNLVGVMVSEAIAGALGGKKEGAGQ